MLPNVLQVHLRKCEKTNSSASGGVPQQPQQQRQPSGPPNQPGNPGQENPVSSPLPEQSMFHQGEPGFGMGSQGFPDQSQSPLMGGKPSPNPYGGSPGAGGPIGIQGGMDYNQRYIHMPSGNVGTITVNPPHGDQQQQLYPGEPIGSFPMHGGIGPHEIGGHQEGTTFPSVYSPPPPQPPQNSGMSSHFLANDRPLDKGGGNGRLPPSSGVAMTNDGHNCSACDIGYSDKASLEEHLKTHRPFTCDTCDKRFSQKCNLITHQRLHTGERPYQCSQCDKRFTQKGNLDAHFKTHAKDRPHNCPTCEKKFSFRASLLSHAKQAHGLILDDLDDGLTDMPNSPSFSPGIPTPQSSLESVCNGQISNPDQGLYSDSESGQQLFYDSPTCYNGQSSREISISSSLAVTTPTISPTGDNQGSGNGHLHCNRTVTESRTSLVMS